MLKVGKMRKYLKLFLFNLAALWAVANLLEGVSYQGGYQNLVLASLTLTIVGLFIKPLINLLLLPINLITLGSFRWLVSVITLYLVTLLVPQFKISGFLFSGFSYQGFIFPQLYLSIFWVFVLASFLISLITTFLLWLTK